MNLALSYHLKHDLVLRALWRRARAAAVPAEINGELAIDRGLWTDRRSERRTASDADDSGVREPGDNASGPNGREVAEAKAEGGITRDLISPFENLAVRHRDFQRAVVRTLANELEPRGTERLGIRIEGVHIAGNGAGAQRDSHDGCSNAAGKDGHRT